MSTPDFDYSLGVLIILLMSFWFTCKCIGGHQHHSHQKCEGMAPGFYYGNTPFLYGSERDIGYIRTVKKKVEVPNSKTAMSDLYSGEDYKPKATGKESEHSDIQVQKQAATVQNKVPVGTTATRQLIQQSQ